MDQRVEAILLQYPFYKDFIMKEIAENEEFGNLCMDYELCLKKLRNFTVKAMQGGPR